MIHSMKMLWWGGEDIFREKNEFVCVRVGVRVCVRVGGWVRQLLGEC